MVTFIFALFTGENLSCVSLVGVRGLVPQCHRGHSHVSLFEFEVVRGAGLPVSNKPNLRDSCCQLGGSE